MIADTPNAASSATPSIPASVAVVEVVGGEKTGSAAIERALAFYTAIGEQPTHVQREVPGYVANQLQAALWREALHLVAEGIASVADVDKGISARPGLRWALMGPNLTFHLAGGVGGIYHFLDQFAAPMANWWETLGNPTLTSELKERLAAGITAETAGRGIAELAAWRDRFLVDLLPLRAGQK
jgi:carnitine 3-dehydrogenase